MASILHGRKFSRTQSPPKDLQQQQQQQQQPSAINNAILEPMDNVNTRPQPTKSTRVPSLQKSYYSDSGTGSYSGVEVPLLESPEGHALTPEILQGSRGTALEQSLAKSLSVAIPIPLFTSEQYRVREYGKDDPDRLQEQYQHMNGGHRTSLQRFSRPVYRVTSTASAQDPTGSPFLVIQGCDEAGVLRSNSWSCQGALTPRPQYRTQSTQTLSREYPPLQQQSSPAPAAPQQCLSSSEVPEALSTTPLLVSGEDDSPHDPPESDDPPRQPEEDENDSKVVSRES